MRIATRLDLHPIVHFNVYSIWESVRKQSIHEVTDTHDSLKYHSYIPDFRSRK